MDELPRGQGSGRRSRRYRKSPLIEALCEIQYEPRTEWDLTAVGLIYERLKEQFPQRRQTKVLGVEIAAQPEINALRHQMTLTDRVQFVRADDTALVQIGPHFLAVNHLKPYSSWETFEPLIRQAVGAYCEVAVPTGIHRVGLRYINRIEFTELQVQLQDYFNFYPQLAGDLPQDHGEFQMTVQFPQGGSHDVLKVQLASVGAPDPAPALWLDLDYFLTAPGTLDVGTMLSWVDVAHARIEDMFELIITPRLREMFEEVLE